MDRQPHLNVVHTHWHGLAGLALCLNCQCFRERNSGRMARRRDGSSSSESSSPNSQSSLEDGRSPSSSTGSQEFEEGETNRGDPMEGFYAGKARIDSKPTTLTLEESSIGFYFGTLLRDGEMSKEGREKLRNKYFLEPTWFAKLQPPQLDDTKLSSLTQRESRDSNESRLAAIHSRWQYHIAIGFHVITCNSRVRDAAKLGLATLEHVATPDPHPGERTDSQVPLRYPICPGVHVFYLEGGAGKDQGVGD